MNGLTRSRVAIAVLAMLIVGVLAFLATRSSNRVATEAAPETTTTTTSTTAAPTSTASTTITPTTIASTTTTTSSSTPARQVVIDPAVREEQSEQLARQLAELEARRAAELAEEAAENEEDEPDAAPPTTAPPAGPAPVQISRPSCAAGLAAPVSTRAPFTGKTASIHPQIPAVVVKVSNNSSASRRALVGLDQADIVFEERIEASATRFFSVYHSSLPANVGPVRSGRTTDIQITENLNRPVFAYSGSNQGVARQLKFAADNNLLIPFINTDRAPFARDGRYSAPDNLFVDPTSLAACGGASNPTAVFSYGAPSSTTAQPASSVSLQARSPYRFDWNGSAWVRSQSGTPHVTRTGAALDPDNVVVMFAKTVQSQIDSSSVDTQTVGSGEAWIFRNGTITVGAWRRDRGHEPYTLTDANGTNVRLKAGQTWVVLAPAGTASWN